MWFKYLGKCNGPSWTVRACEQLATSCTVSRIYYLFSSQQIPTQQVQLASVSWPRSPSHSTALPCNSVLQQVSWKSCCDILHTLLLAVGLELLKEKTGGCVVHIPQPECPQAILLSPLWGIPVSLSRVLCLSAFTPKELPELWVPCLLQSLLTLELFWMFWTLVEVNFEVELLQVILQG